MARELSISRNTVAKYLSADIQMPDQMRQQRPAEPDADTYKSLNNNIDSLP
jgi:transposase